MPYSSRSSNVEQTALSALQATALFASLPDKVGYDLFAASQKLALSKGKPLYLQDDEADWFYLVLSGWIKVFRETFDGEEAVIELAGSGQFVGELAVLEDGRYSCNASIAGDAVLLRLPTSLLEAAIKSNHEVALAMLCAMSKKRLEHMKEVEGLKLQKADQRIGCFVLRLCGGQEGGTSEIELPYCKSLIAAQLGMKGETFSRALNKLKKTTGIDVKGSTITVPDMASLSDFVCVGCSNEYPCKDLLGKDGVDSSAR
jgi:CRP-like cAMP-binding protein